MIELNELIDHVYRLSVKRYGGIYRAHLGFESLFSDVNYVIATRVLGKETDEPVRLAMVNMKSHMIDRLRNEGPENRSGLIKRMKVRLDEIFDTIETRTEYAGIAKMSAIAKTYEEINKLDQHEEIESNIISVALINKRIEKLTDREKDILQMRIEGYTLKETAKKHNISIIWTSFLIARIIKYLRTGNIDYVRHAAKEDMKTEKFRMSISPKKPTHYIDCCICGKEVKVIDSVYRKSKTKMFCCDMNCQAVFKTRPEYKGIVGPPKNKKVQAA